ncbi:MAG: tRNA nucleotidyltransferase [Oscillospiraceae bacterium]|nr:tRNA nucleotidyltransferase [Oscillospiraceae bacterium]
MREMETALAIARAAAEAGGRAYFVGGWVRDGLLGRESKDVDLEVHGVTPERLTQILDGLGPWQSMGESFGILRLRHVDLDISLPRAEDAKARGGRNFAAGTDPFLGLERAARRRDFTIDALMQDVLSGEILDFFGGQRDLREGRIRMVGPDCFAADPLRAFRAARFATRFGFQVEEETRAAAAAVSTEGLAAERVMGETEKALLKAARPSRFFEELRRMGQLEPWLPELRALIGVPQPPVHHPEGDVWEHSMQVLDQAALLRSDAREPLGLMLAALCHDFGKALCTEEREGSIHAYGHEEAGLPPVGTFLGRLGREKKLGAYVRDMTRLHMLPNMLVAQGAKPRSFLRLFDRAICPEDLLLLARADHLGRRAPGDDGDALAEGYRPIEARLREMLALYWERMARPALLGRDLQELGLEPGPLYGEVLGYAHKLQLAGISLEEQRRHVAAYIRNKKEDAR